MAGPAGPSARPALRSGLRRRRAVTCPAAWSPPARAPAGQGGLTPKRPLVFTAETKQARWSEPAGRGGAGSAAAAGAGGRGALRDAACAGLAHGVPAEFLRKSLPARAALCAATSAELLCLATRRGRGQHRPWSLRPERRRPPQPARSRARGHSRSRPSGPGASVVAEVPAECRSRETSTSAAAPQSGKTATAEGRRPPPSPPWRERPKLRRLRPRLAGHSFVIAGGIPESSESSAVRGSWT